jgi:outer membrane protein OmpA-like peptidoglycan-associated protein
MALGLVSSANAEWYIGPEGGAVFLDDPTANVSCPRVLVNETNFARVSSNNPLCPPDPGFKAHMDTGWAVGGNVGYAGLFIPNLRVEGEIAYRSNSVNGIQVTPPGTTFSATGNVNSLAFMANAYYDFLNSSAFTPYLGGGVGAARVSLDSLAFTALPGFKTSGSDWQFAYQGIAGVRYNFTPNWSVHVDYRYFATSDPSFSFFGSPKASTQYHTQNVMVGLTYHFVQPPPPPPPVAAAPPAPPPAAPPPAPPKQFVVYFEFDKSNLTPEGAKVVSDAAAAFKAGGSAQVAVAGYTDLAGTQQYNVGLSKRRADTVRAALVKAGVPDNVIAESWHGKENPAVPTPDGVREPRNRRVEIML